MRSLVLFVVLVRMGVFVVTVAVGAVGMPVGRRGFVPALMPVGMMLVGMMLMGMTVFVIALTLGTVGMLVGRRNAVPARVLVRMVIVSMGVIVAFAFAAVRMAVGRGFVLGHGAAPQ